MGDLSTNFSRSEFACKCGCGLDEVEEELIRFLQALRDKVGPIKIISGCRCPDHNASKKVGGSKNSSHITGVAADISVPGVDPWIVLWAIERIRKDSEVFGDELRVGIGRSKSGGLKLHVDMDIEKGTKWWVYFR